MEQYISKTALVEEIKRQILAIDSTPKITDTQISVLSGNKVVLTKLLSFLDTLEVKEVDLEKECSKYFEDNDDLCVHDDYIKFARHFFELGIKAKHRKEKRYE